jgi:hypothetical protein
VTFVLTMAEGYQGAVTFVKTFDKLANVNIFVYEPKFIISTSDYVVFSLSFKFISVEKISYF